MGSGAPFFRETRLLLWAGLLALIFLTACKAPEGGSSLPWNRPQSWESQMPTGMGPTYSR
ncbi:MAG: hypothetical protein FJ388_12245 [Verrucomicrobia bacterium]|nr:hypothetical protein [Verrucomicrobiota bacterium]